MTVRSMCLALLATSVCNVPNSSSPAAPLPWAGYRSLEAVGEDGGVAPDSLAQGRLRRDHLGNLRHVAEERAGVLQLKDEPVPSLHHLTFVQADGVFRDH